jgi:hypothetical protein
VPCSTFPGVFLSNSKIAFSLYLTTSLLLELYFHLTIHSHKLQHITVQHNDGQFPSMMDSSVCQMLHATKGLRGLVLHWSAPTSPVLLQLHPHTTCLHVKLPKPLPSSLDLPLNRLHDLTIQGYTDFDATSLRMRDCDLSCLREARKLTRLQLVNMRPSQAMFHLTQLRELSFIAAPSIHDLLAGISALQQLSKLDLRDQHLQCHLGLKALANLPQLHELTLGRLSLHSDDAPAVLKHLTSLTVSPAPRHCTQLIIMIAYLMILMTMVAYMYY